MDDSGFPRTPDRPVKLLGTCVRYLRSVETSIGARGPDFLGGSATVDRSPTYYPEHILVYGRGKAHCSLVMGFGSFRTD